MCAFYVQGIESAETSMTLQPGTLLGVYEILDPLGAGGMGEVYRARDRKLGRDVALKILPEEFASDPARVARFEREARMLAAVNHPGIAAIYGAEQDGATRYIVMELVAGETLAEKLATGPLAIPDVLRIGAQIAEALEVAHEKGVIHRDLKPANIKVTPEGKVKVLDFGLAKAMDLPFAGDMSRSPTIVMEDSQPGDIVGTPEFMSPEQARGKETDRRTDIWSFGCILFEALTGRRAFTGETVPDAVSAILSQEPDWSALPARTPQRVRDLLKSCLEKDAARRLRDAGDVRLELEATLAGLSGTGTLYAAPRRFPWWKAGAAAVVVALAIGGYAWLRPKPPPSGPLAGRQIAVLPFRNLTGSPDGELWGLGMVETVSARLADVPGLQVVTPRASVEAADEDPNFIRVAQRLGANTLLAGTLQREQGRFRITYRLVDAQGNQLAAAAIDGTELFPLQDRVADGVVRDLHLRRGARRTPTPPGLDTELQQERYLQAIGLLQRYDRREGVEKALQILQGLAEERPGSALAQSALARANLAMFDFTKDRVWTDRAIAANDAARAADPGLPEVDITTGETLLLTGRSREAVAAFRRALSASPDKVDALLGLGRAAEAAGDDAAAEEAFRRAIVLQPSFAVFNQLGGLYADRGRWPEAAAMFRRATEAAPDSYRAYSNLGGVSVLGCDFASAEPAFRKALALRPGHPPAASNLGLTQLWTGRAKDAVASLEVAARGAPSNYQIWAAFGDALAETGEKTRAADAYARSITLARDALKLNPSDSIAHSVLGTSLARTGHGDDAAREMQAALTLDDKEPSTLADAATVAVLRGETPAALEWMRRAVAAGYCPQILARQPEFASLRGTPEFQSIVAAPRKAAGS
jgi:Flp pilus assembly protein TadD/TolB-like protein